MSHWFSVAVSAVIAGSLLGCGEEDAKPPPPVSLGDRVSVNIWGQEHQPLTRDETGTAGYELIDDTAECHELYGFRYRKATGAGANKTEARLTPTLMYDASGNLAGMQAIVDKDVYPLYPASNLKGNLNTTGNEAGFTLHFMDPTKICSKDVPAPANGSIGDRLWVRTDAKGGFESIPLIKSESDKVPDGYAPGGCAGSGFAFKNSPGMGVHHWRDTYRDVNCEDSGPMFLLYNDENRLVAVGFIFMSFNFRVPTVGGIEPVRRPAPTGPWRSPEGSSELWEWAEQPLFPNFFSEEDNPKCGLQLNSFDRKDQVGTIDNVDVTATTLHVHFSDPYNIKCPKDVEAKLLKQ